MRGGMYAVGFDPLIGTGGAGVTRVGNDPVDGAGNPLPEAVIPKVGGRRRGRTGKKGARASRKGKKSRRVTRRRRTMRGGGSSGLVGYGFNGGGVAGLPNANVYPSNVPPPGAVVNPDLVMHA
jgi:hypothetical protein